MHRSLNPNQISRKSGLFLSALILGGVLSGCGSSAPESGSDMPERPEPRAYKTPVTKSTQPTLGRVVDESRRRREVIRQLETIFANPKP